MNTETSKMGDNSGGIDGAERQARFFTHLNPIYQLEEQRLEIVAQMTKLKRQAKADGFEGYEVAKGLEVRKAEKPETITNRATREMAVLKFMQQPAGFQFNFLDEQRTPAVDLAYQGGMIQALREEANRNPHDQSTPQWKAHNDGFSDGVTQMREAKQSRKEDERARAEEAAKPKEGAPAGTTRGRGRPPGSTNKPKGAKGAKGKNGKGGDNVAQLRPGATAQLKEHNEQVEADQRRIRDEEAAAAADSGEAQH